jgi:release factor glutamine methyltransferase
MMTVLEVVRRTAEFLSGKGVESARLNAELIVGHALGLPRMQLYLQFERPLAESELERIRPLVRRRGQREPLQYVVGEVEFGGLRLKADRRALIPRPETEFLVETLVGRFPDPPARVLDLGTGSGAIALSLAAAWPSAAVTAVDVSPDALSLAEENAASAGLAGRVGWLRSDWFSAVPAGSRFDLIVANPPYLTDEEVARAEPEVRDFEPRSALAAPDGGAAAWRSIVASAPGFLAPGGMLALETGIGHRAAAIGAASEAGLVRAEGLPDLTGRDRFVLAWAG